jgi:phenylalanyl-tRNA synthetase beta subunit
MVRNLAFTLTGRVAAQDIATHLMSVGPDWLQQVRIVDYFGHKEPLERTITYELAFSTKDIQPTADQVNALCENLINKVQSQFSGVALR